MDDRKKKITELGRFKKEQAILLDSLFSRFGETLFVRIADSPQEDISVFGELTEYRRFMDGIAASEISIQAVEEQMRRLSELEDGIKAQEREGSAYTQDLTAMHGSLGKLLLDAAASGVEYVDFYAPYREQAEALVAKIVSLEDRLATLEQKGKSNVFAWIGKSAQGLMLRTFLTKEQENMEQLRRNVGERYTRDSAIISEDDVQVSYSHATAAIEELFTEITQKREEFRAVSQDLETLKEEKKEISDSFNAEGSALKQIQGLKKNITHIRNELNALCRRIGTEAISINGSQSRTPAARRQFFDTFIGTEDQETLDSAAQINGTILEAEAEIERLRASLAIDAEKAKIEKYRKMILDRQNKIAQAEDSIAGFEVNIRDSETSIEKLQKLLQ